VVVPSSGVEVNLNEGTEQQIETISHLQRLLGEVVLSKFAVKEPDIQTDRQTPE